MAGPSSNLQEAAGKYLISKYKTKPKIDQVSMDFLTSIDYHKNSSVETDLFYRFFVQQYGEQDLMFFLFERSLAERELSIKLAQLSNNVDIR